MITKFKILTGIAAIGTGVAWSIVALSSSGISQSVEVGGVNQYPAIAVRGDAGVGNNLQVGGTAAATTVLANVLDGGTLVVTGPASLGGTVTGAWSVSVVGTVAGATDYGAFTAASTVTGAKFRDVSCWSEAGTGIGTATLAIRNVTDGTNLCTGSLNCGVSTPVAVFDCNQAFLGGKVYALRETVACSVTDITTLNCNIEISH